MLSDSQVGTTRGNEDAIVTTTNPTTTLGLPVHRLRQPPVNAPPRERAGGGRYGGNFFLQISARVQLILPSHRPNLAFTTRAQPPDRVPMRAEACCAEGRRGEASLIACVARVTPRSDRTRPSRTRSSRGHYTDRCTTRQPTTRCATLQLLNFEVALFRDDPNANEILARVAETPGVSTCQLRAVADLAFECGRRELGARALEHTYARLEALEPPPYVDLIDVLRDLIRTSDGRSSALQHFKRALPL